MRRGIVRPEDVTPGAPLGQRQTRQRDAVLGVIAEASGPLSVPEIHQRAQDRQIGIGIATIYRTLKLLQEGGQVQAVILPSANRALKAPSTGTTSIFSVGVAIRFTTCTPARSICRTTRFYRRFRSRRPRTHAVWYLPRLQPRGLRQKRLSLLEGGRWIRALGPGIMKLLSLEGFPQEDKP